ncbi:MAG: DNA topoisomerase I, partial [Desulfobacterales bacterium]|nr:DNA topoisomerase I [Desulfobacterales bacterium]
GSSIKFPGFMALYMSVDEEIKNKDRNKKENLPADLVEGMVLALEKYAPKQHFTQPPPRYSEASLVKELEENGIGRPSTYAAIISTIRGKGYVDFLKGNFRPSELGFIVNDLIVASFPEIIGVDFTAKLENELDSVESAKTRPKDLLSSFYDRFKAKLDEAAEGMISVKGVGFPTDLKCPECENTLHIKIGRNGHFLACNGYPECKYSRDYTRDEKGRIQAVEQAKEEATDKICAKCGRPMVIKRGRYGAFIACTGFPECKHTESINGNGYGESTGVKCPGEDCKGELVERRSKRGKVFYGCSSYPDCTYALWDKPVEKECPDCDSKFLVEKSTKKQGDFYACPTKGCRYKEAR